MIYLSQVLNQPVLDASGQRAGTVNDLIVALGEVFPIFRALVVSVPRGRGLVGPSESLLVPWADVADWTAPPLRLKVRREEIRLHSPQPNELWLARDLLDKQIVDTHGRRVVKVNDLKLTEVGGVARLVGADIGARALLRRLGAEGPATLLKLPERLVTWNYVEPLESTLANVQLTIPHTKLAELHPADIADIIEQMTPTAGTAVLESLEPRVAAEALEEMAPRFQASILETLDSRRASDLLEELPPDEAADILGDLPAEKATELLARMEHEAADGVRALMRYDKNTAGGLMTPEVLTLPLHITVDEAIARLRREGLRAEAIWYLYAVDEENRLMGVVSFRHLLTAPPETKIEAIMDHEVVKVTTDTDQEEVARLITKYDLLALPVVDGQGVLRGVVTVDDIIDVLEEEATEDLAHLAGASAAAEEDVSIWGATLRRLGWLTATLVGGLVAGFILHTYARTLLSALALIYFVPLLLSAGYSMAGQSVATVGRRLSLDGICFGPSLWRELATGGATGLLCGAAGGLVAYLWAGRAPLALMVGVSLALTAAAAAALGVLVPFTLRRLRLDPTFLARPIAEPLIGVLSILFYLGLATFWLKYLV